MAITATQRRIGMDALLKAYGDDTRLGQLLPGVTSAQMLNALAAALGTQFDAQLTTALANYVALIDANTERLNGAIASAQAARAAAVVT